MTGGVYYNEFDPQAADWLENLIADGLIPRGIVDRRSISDVQPGDLEGFFQCHFFAGIGGWALAAELAGYPADWPLWSGSCPCQPFSLAGEKLGSDDHRHLWPDFFRLIDARRPPVVVGEQVAGALGYGWFDGVRADLGRGGYASRTCDIPASAVDSPQIRQRLYWIGILQDHLASGDCAGLRPLGGDDSQNPGAAAGERWPDYDAALPGGRDAPGAGGAEPVGGTHRGGLEHAWLAAVGQTDISLASGPDGPAPSGTARPGSMASAPGELGGELQPERGPEGRIAVAGDDAGERPAGVALGDTEEFGSGPGLRQAGPERHGVEPSDADGPSDLRGAALGRAARWRLALGEQPDRVGGDAPGGGDAPRADVPNGSWWADHRWIVCHDGKVRRVPEPPVPLLVAGISGRLAVLRSGEITEAPQEGDGHRWVIRVPAWKGFGNAINPVLGAEVLRALMDE